MHLPVSLDQVVTEQDARVLVAAAAEKARVTLAPRRERELEPDLFAVDSPPPKAAVGPADDGERALREVRIVPASTNPEAFPDGPGPERAAEGARFVVVPLPVFRATAEQPGKQEDRAGKPAGGAQ